MDNTKGQYAFSDQTNDEWQQNYKGQYGTGIYLTPDGGQALAMVGLTYENFLNTVARTEAITVKWIPERISTFEQLLAQGCAPHPCAKTCVSYGCLCHPVTNTCVGL